MHPLKIGDYTTTLLNSGEIIFIISSDGYSSPEWDSNLDPSRIAVFEDCKATALTTQPPRLDNVLSYFVLFLSFNCYRIQRVGLYAVKLFAQAWNKNSKNITLQFLQRLSVLFVLFLPNK